MANLTLRAVKGSPLTNAEMDGNFEYFTGSHAITGSLIVTGGITGSVQGIISSSYAVTASYIQNAQSASYVLNAQSASYVLNAVSASRATTSSYALTAQTLLGSIQSASYALTASNSSTASYVAGGSVDGVVALATNALSSIEVYTAKVNADGDYKVLFTDNVNLDDSSNLYKDTNSTFLYNPGLNKLTVGALSASAGITGSLLGDASAVTPLSQSVVITGSLTQLSGSVSLGVADAGSGNRNINTFTSGLNEYVVIGAGNGVSSLKLNTIQLNGASGTVSVAAANSISLLSSNIITSGSILISGSIIPNVPVGSTTSSFNLGSPTAAWKDIYVSNGTINFLNSAGAIVQTMGTGNNQLTGYTIISGSLAQGFRTTASGLLSHAEGNRTTASGDYSHAEGYFSTAKADVSHAEGYFSTAGLPAWDTNSTVNGTTQLPSSIGNITSSFTPGTIVALGTNYLIVSRSFFQANLTQVQYVSASTLSLGGGTALAIIDIYNPLAIYPNQTLRTGYAGHAEGTGNTALFGHAEGNNSVAFGSYSHAEGIGTIAVADGQHTSGKFNATSTNPDDLFIIGNGDDNSNRKNILLVSTSSLVVSGSILISGSIIPNVSGSTTSSFNLGSPTAAWKDIYVSNGTINFLNSNGTVAQTMGTGNNQLVGNTSVNGAFSVTGSVFVKDVYPVVFGKSNNTNFSNSTFLHGKSNQVGTDATYAHVEGTNNNVDGYASHAEGVGNQIWSGATGSHAEGYGTQIYGDPFTIGEEGSYSHTEGYYTVSSGSYSHAEGYYSVTIGSASHAEGAGNYTYGPYSHAEGSGNITIGEGSHAEGQLNSTLGIYSHAEGLETQTTGAFSHAEGYGSIAVGDYTHAEGGGGNNIGVGGYAVGKASHAEGVLTVTIGTGSHAEGYRTHAKGWYSHAEGFYTSASGNYSHAEGSNTIASGSYQHVQGQFNTQGDSTSLMIVGNGTSDGARRDAFKVRMSGSIILPTTQSSIPAWSGSNGEMVFATVSGANLFYVWMGNQWRSGSLA
jgi:trimeric autotransporter adhesin